MEGNIMRGVPFMITGAMREALYARGFSTEQIAELTPEAAHKILQTPDSRAVREFVATITAQAQTATEDMADPGLLQVVLVHPRDDDVTGVYRYELDDAELIERMTREAVSASEAGHNVYVEGRTVRRGLAGKQRGGHADTVAVFALVIDSDHDKDAAWAPTVPMSLTVETSAGNAHYWLFLDKAVDADTGKRLGEQIRAATGADADTGNVCQPFRLAGTTNFPNKKKLERGRIVTWTRAVEFDPERLWNAEQIEQAFPREPKPGQGGGGGERKDIPADTMRVIRDGVGEGQRSTAFFNVVLALKRLGFDVESVIDLLEQHPDGIARKYEGRLRQEVERIWRKLKDEREDEDEADDDTSPVLRWHGDADIRDSRPWAVQDLLPEVGSGLLSGQWGTYKTFTGFDLAHAVMSGEAFLGFEVVRRGGVLFVAAEGQSEVVIRLQGLIEDRGKIAGRAPFAWVETCPPLIGTNALPVLTKLAQEAAAKLKAEFDLPLSVIVIDTIVAAAGYNKDGQDNDTALGQVLMRTLARLARNAGCFVLGIDHFGKDVNVGTRGTSAKEGAAEVVFAMLGDKTIAGEITNTRLALRKRRSGASGQEFPFTARSVNMGTDEHGKPVTTLVLDWGAAAPKAKAKEDWGRGRGMKALKRVIMGLMVDHGTNMWPFADGPQVRALKLDLVRTEFIKSWPAEGPTEKAKRDGKTLNWRRAIEAAVDKGVVKVREVQGEEVVWLASVTTGPCQTDMDF
jgi:hypothetical protein